MPWETLKNLEEKQKEIATMIPETMANFKAVHDATMKDGALTAREKALIGLGIAVAKQCSYCIVKHLKAAIDMNISLEEIIEACGVSMLMNGGPGVAYTTFVLDTYKKLTEDKK